MPHICDEPQSSTARMEGLEEDEDHIMAPSLALLVLSAFGLPLASSSLVTVETAIASSLVTIKFSCAKAFCTALASAVLALACTSFCSQFMRSVSNLWEHMHIQSDGNVHVYIYI